MKPLKQSRGSLIVPLRVTLLTPDVTTRSVRMIEPEHLRDDVFFDLAVLAGGHQRLPIPLAGLFPGALGLPTLLPRS